MRVLWHPKSGCPKGAHVAAKPHRATMSAFTMIELLVVLVILAALAGGVVTMLGSTTEDAQQTIAAASLRELRDAIMGSPAAPGYFEDMRYVSGGLPRQLADLFRKAAGAPDFDKNTRKGWRGPYARSQGGIKKVTNASNTGYPAPGDRRFAPAVERQILNHETHEIHEFSWFRAFRVLRGLN